MKILIRTKIIVFLITVVTALGSCKKGDKGDTGLAGANGTNGIDGVNGNANVIGTNTITLTSANWTLSGSSYGATITAAGITQDIVDKGSVQVFIKYGTSWWSLPDINGINSTSFGFGVGIVSLYNANSNNTTPTIPGSQTYRVVIISASNRLAYPHTNWSNYNEVQQVFNLKD